MQAYLWKELSLIEENKTINRFTHFLRELPPVTKKFILKQR